MICRLGAVIVSMSWSAKDTRTRGPRVTEASAVLFDLDGTLIDRRQVYLACHRLAAAEVLGRPTTASSS
jgi:hypothetical protein